MASYDAQINILLSGQRNLQNLANQLIGIEESLQQIQRRSQAANVNLGRARLVADVFGRNQPRGPGGRFAADPGRQERFAALAAERRAEANARRLRRLAAFEQQAAQSRIASTRQQLEGEERLIQRAERRIALESRLNSAVTIFQRQQRAYARGGAGARLPEALQQQAATAQAAFEAAGGPLARNLRLVQSLAREMTTIAEAQREINRSSTLQSKGFYKSQEFERRIVRLREAGVQPSAFRTVGRQMSEYRSALARTDQPGAEDVARRIDENLKRISRELDQSFTDFRRADSARRAARSWQTFFEDAASAALQIRQNSAQTRDSWRTFFEDAASQALQIRQNTADTRQSWQVFFEDAANQALQIRQNAAETRSSWASFFESAANQALQIKQNAVNTRQSWQSFFVDAANQALQIKQNATNTKESWQAFFGDAANQALQIKQNAIETRNSWQTFFSDAANQALQVRQNAAETKESWKLFFEDAANQALAVKQNAAQTKESWKTFFDDAASQALQVEQNAAETRESWQTFFIDAANQALQIKQNAAETRRLWQDFFADAANQALQIKQYAAEAKESWRSFFEDAANQALLIKQNAAQTKNSWKSFFESAAEQALSIKENAIQTKESWRSFFIDAANQALQINQNAAETRENWRLFFEDAGQQALQIRQNASDTRSNWQSFFEDAAQQALQIKENAVSTKESWKSFFDDAAGQVLEIKQNAASTKKAWKDFFDNAANQALEIKQNAENTKNAWREFFVDATNQAQQIKQNAEATKQSWKDFFVDAAQQALQIQEVAKNTKNSWKGFFEDAANQALEIKRNAAETKDSWELFFEDAANQALSIKQSASDTRLAWQQFFEDAEEQAKAFRRNPIAAMTPEERRAAGILDPASLRASRRAQVERGRERQEAFRSAGSEGLIGGMFPLLFGQDAGAAVFGGLGGALGGLAGGGLGFGLSLAGTAIGSAVDEAEKLEKELAKVNVSAKGIGNTSKDIDQLASALRIAKDEAVKLLGEFSQFGSAQLRRSLAFVFGGGSQAVFDRLESASKESDVLEAIAGVRKEIGNEEARSLLNVFKAEGSLKAQIALEEALARAKQKTAIEQAKVVTLGDRFLAALSAGAAPMDQAGPGTDPASFGKRRAAILEKQYADERAGRVKNFQEALKDSKKFFDELNKLTESSAGVDKKALAGQLLSALDARTDAIENARRQREEQIAEIRKRSIEQAAQIERGLADRRRDMEREIADIRLKRADESEDIQRRIRIARGENPEIVRAEQELADIYRRGRDERTELERRLADDERNQAREIADFQKDVAKQLRDADTAHNRRMGEIQREYAKATAKIMEEGSGKAGKRVAEAYELLILRLQRQSLNAQRVAAGADPIPVPTMAGSGLSYPGLPRERVNEVVSPIFQQRDRRMLELERKLQSSAQAAPATQLTASLSGVVGSGATNASIGDQFVSLLQNESGFEDVAGLQALPIERMRRQAARPLRMVWEQITNAMEGAYQHTEREIKKMFKPDPARNKRVLEKIGRMGEMIQNWNPLEAQWKETENRLRVNKRSKLVPTPVSAVKGIVRVLIDPIIDRTNEAELDVTQKNRDLGSFRRVYELGRGLGSTSDLSYMLNDNEKSILKKTILDVIDANAPKPINLPLESPSRESLLNAANRLFGYEKELFDAGQNIEKSLKPIISSFREFYRGVIDEARWMGRPSAEAAVRAQFRGQSGPSPEMEQWLQKQKSNRSTLRESLFSPNAYKKFLERPRVGGMGAAAPDAPITTDMFERQIDDQMRLHRRLMELGEPPRINPGFDMEGAMLPSNLNFDVSKLGADFGTIAAASFMRGILPDQQLAQAQRIKVIPVSQQTTLNTPSLRGGAAQTTQARERLRRAGTEASRAKELDEIVASFAEANLGAAQYKNNLEEQLSLIRQQSGLVSAGFTPEQAAALGEIEVSYERAKLNLLTKVSEERKRGRLSEEQIQVLRDGNLKTLEETYIENVRLTLEYQKQVKALDSIQEKLALQRQIAVTGAGARAGFFGQAASAYEAELLRSGDRGRASEMAGLTRTLERGQTISGMQQELNSLMDPFNMAVTGGQALGQAVGAVPSQILSGAIQSFQQRGQIEEEISRLERLKSSVDSNSEAYYEYEKRIAAARGELQGIATTADLVKNAFQAMLQSIAQALLDQSAKIIATYIAIGIAKAFAFGGGGGGSLNIGDMQKYSMEGPISAGMFGGFANGGAFTSAGAEPFANGGAFTNSIVSSPTLFQFADGGVMKMGVMGEAGDEAVMPLDRDSSGRLGVRASGLREALAATRSAIAPSTTEQSSAAFEENRRALDETTSIERERAVERVLASGAGSTEIKYSRVGSGDLPFVTEEDMLQATRAAAEQGAKLGQQRTIAALRNNPGTRRSIGV